MTKEQGRPADIPEEVWTAAYKAVYRGDWTVVEQVAFAILAAKAEERSGCLQEVLTYTGHPNELAAFIAAEIVESIRKRGEG